MSAAKSEWKPGNLPTLNQDEYPGLGGWWVNIWQGEGPDAVVVARAYGDTPDHARQRAQEIAGAAPQQAAPAVGDDLRDRLVAISAAIADQDDRSAQAMLREILAAPQQEVPSADQVEEVPCANCGEGKNRHNGLRCVNGAENAYFAPQADSQPAPDLDIAVMQLAESVGLIGPASRVHGLHAAIQRFHDLICVNATIKAAVMAADVIRGAATSVRDYPPLPMQFACSGVFPVYSADQMRAYVDADRAARAPADSQPAPQGETNVQLDIDPNSPTPGQQRGVAGPVAVGQPVGHGSDSTAGDPSTQGNKLLTVAERNIRSFLRSAVFKSESDREAALNCVDVLRDAARAPADSQPALTPEAASAMVEANWEQLRSALAMLMLGWGRNPNQTMDACYRVLDSATEPGKALAILRAAPDWRDFMTAHAQAADSVLEDAARNAIDKVLALFPFNATIQTFTIGGGPRLTADGDIEFYSVKRVLAFLTEIKTTLDAARKQGANHD